jgi:putative addiction module component (TIGR02574 family)
MTILTKPQIDALTVDERLKLIDDLWDSLEHNSDLIPTPDWQAPLIEARIKAQELNPRPTHTWESVRSEMEEKWLA